MQCADFRDVLTAGASPQQRPVMWVHRRRCAKCRALAEGIQQVRTGLREQPVHTPPQGLRTRLLTMVGDTDAVLTMDRMAAGAAGTAALCPEGPRRLALRSAVLGLATILVLGIALYPVVRRVQEWVGAGDSVALRPEPIPATKEAGDLAVTLTALKPARIALGGDPPYELESLPDGNRGASWREGPPPGDGRERGPVIEACLELKQAGKPTDEWLLTQATVTDAKGRVVADAAQQQQWAPNGRSFVWLQGPPGAAVWRVTMSYFASVSYPGFGQDELWTVRNVAVPGPTAPVLAAGTTAEVQGVSLRVIGLVPPGRTTYSGGALTSFEAVPYAGNGLSWETESSSQSAVVQTSLPSVVVRASHWTPDYSLSMRAVDDRGTALAQAGSASDAPHAGGMLQVMTLKVPPDAKTLDLTFVVQKVRTVEFVVKLPASE